MNFEHGFKTILIANRGEIALRVLTTLEKMDISSAVVYHYEDRNAPWVAKANAAYEVLGPSPTAAYLDAEQIIAICQNNQIDAVHPGYGFLSESAKFVLALQSAGIVFIGPSATAIDLMGDKIRSREFVKGLGVNVLESVEVDLDEQGLFNDQNLSPDLEKRLEELPMPLVIKASAGGGGKGMSVVYDPKDLAAQMKIASSEAKLYFSDGRIYVEPYIEKARHIEVQILADGETALHVGERECSLQRRFQKLLEETPCVALNEQTRERLLNAASTIAHACSYDSVGTVEFILNDTDAKSSDFYFLEMNTRIQVEHTVTEMSFGLDLIEQQILLAAKSKLKFGQDELESKRHSIEVRVCAEDPYNDFSPEIGKVLFHSFPKDGEYRIGENAYHLRIDSAVYSDQLVTTSFDSMLAKVIVSAANRNEAISSLIEVLQNTVVLGVGTNIDFLLDVLRDTQFRNAEVDTQFLKRFFDSQEVEGSESESESSTIEQTAQTAAALAYLADTELRCNIKQTPKLYLAIGQWQN